MAEQVGTLCEVLKELTLEQQVLTICPGSALASHCKMQIVPPSYSSRILWRYFVKQPVISATEKLIREQFYMESRICE